MSVTSFQLSWQALSKEDHSLVAVLMWNVAESVLDFSGMKYKILYFRRFVTRRRLPGPRGTAWSLTHKGHSNERQHCVDHRSVGLSLKQEDGLSTIVRNWKQKDATAGAASRLCDSGHSIHPCAPTSLRPRILATIGTTGDVLKVKRSPSSFSAFPQRGRGLLDP